MMPGTSLPTSDPMPYKFSLYIVDNVIMLGDRVVVPKALRSSILHLLHAAHQGVDRMKARSADVVYWPGIVGDIARHREACQACHKSAKSNPSLPPYDPPEPEFPFQYLLITSITGARTTA